jgi:hypothetical protein
MLQNARHMLQSLVSFINFDPCYGPTFSLSMATPKSLMCTIAI